ncbi:hypothetical protein [Caballeronia arvi]|uniref:hypothetical protein n=1 Tax=Caballeronia arvi TaxID=1777135 RepID=UPI00190EE581|nr:hypothetical protein [Caballeronia arvi]
MAGTKESGARAQGRLEFYRNVNFDAGINPDSRQPRAGSHRTDILADDAAAQDCCPRASGMRLMFPVTHAPTLKPSATEMPVSVGKTQQTYENDVSETTLPDGRFCLRDVAGPADPRSKQ